MATLGLKEMGKFLWEGREKGLPCWLSQFSKLNCAFSFLILQTFTTPKSTCGRDRRRDTLIKNKISLDGKVSEAF